MQPQPQALPQAYGYPQGYPMQPNYAVSNSTTMDGSKRTAIPMDHTLADHELMQKIIPYVMIAIGVAYALGHFRLLPWLGNKFGWW